MPKGFSDKEKEIIRNKLLEKGEEFFNTYGVRKTSVENLTRAVGISKGSFYIFFDSKEELFFEIIEAFEKKVKEGLMQDIFIPGVPRKQCFKEFLQKIFRVFEESPMIKNIDKEDLEYLMRKLPEEKLQRHLENDDDFAARFIQQESLGNLFANIDPKVISGLFRSMAYVIIHKDDIGREVYPGVIGLLIDMITDYFIKE